MPFSFGSVGDIISICLLAKDLVEALNSSRGASAEYQEVIRELWGLERALLQIDLLSRSCNSTPELNALHETARRSAEDCRVCIAAFLKKIKKYELSLKANGSGSIFRDASKKVQWQVMQSSEVSKFRAEIGAHSRSISMLLAILSLNAMTVNEKKLHGRLADSDRKIEDEMRKQASLVIEVRDRLEENNSLISAVASTVTSGFRMQWFRQLGSELKNMMHRICWTNIATYKAVVAIQRLLPSHLERTMFRDPFVLEDAIGRISPVHMDFINSWDAFDAILQLRFQDIQGYKKVKNKEYVFQEHATKREIKRTRPWDGAFMPGQRIDMSLVFVKKAEQAEKAKEQAGTSCPNCRAPSTESQDSEVQCAECGMWYRRITEYKDVDPPPVIRVTLARPDLGKVQFGQNAFHGMAFGPKPSNNFPPVSKKRKLEAIDLAEDDIALFKRVRLVTSEERVRFVPGPFRRVQISENDLSLSAATKSKEEELRAWEAFKERERTLGPSHPDTLVGLGSLTRTLRNVGKSDIAEEVLEKTLKAEEATLVEKSPEGLRLLLSSLMTALVDQTKLDAAEELWERATNLFLTNASLEEHDALLRDFDLAHPFRGRSSVQVEDIPFENWQTYTGLRHPLAQQPLEHPRVLEVSVEADQVLEQPRRGDESLVSESVDSIDFLSGGESSQDGEGYILLRSHFLPRTKAVAEAKRIILEFSEESPSVCPKCPMRFSDSAALERHVGMYHPFLYMSKTLAWCQKLPFSKNSNESYWLWTAWVRLNGLEYFLDVLVGWKCCGRRRSTLYEFASITSCTGKKHLFVFSEVVERLKSTLVVNRELAMILPMFPYLNQVFSGQSEQSLLGYCALDYCPESDSWECMVDSENTGSPELLFPSTNIT